MSVYGGVQVYETMGKMFGERAFASNRTDAVDLALLLCRTGGAGETLLLHLQKRRGGPLEHVLAGRGTARQAVARIKRRVNCVVAPRPL